MPLFLLLVPAILSFLDPFTSIMSLLLLTPFEIFFLFENLRLAILSQLSLTLLVSL